MASESEPDFVVPFQGSTTIQLAKENISIVRPESADIPLPGVGSFTLHLVAGRVAPPRELKGNELDPAPMVYQTARAILTKPMPRDTGIAPGSIQTCLALSTVVHDQVNYTTAHGFGGYMNFAGWRIEVDPTVGDGTGVSIDPTNVTVYLQVKVGTRGRLGRFQVGSYFASFITFTGPPQL